MVIKVSREVAEAIEYALENIPGQDKKEHLLKQHVINSTWEADAFKPLNNLSIIQLAEILLNDYEIEKTPEEILQNKYCGFCDHDELDRACKDSFRFVLDTLNIKIKGVNN